MPRNTIITSKKFWYTLISLATAGLIVTVAISWYSMCQLMYPNDRLVEGTPRSQITRRIRQKLCNDYQAETQAFCTEDGLTLAGIYVPRKNPKGHLLVCHGYRHDKEGMSALVEQFQEYSLFLFDFRGHGESEHALITIGYNESRDVHAAMNQYRSCVPANQQDKPWYILGLSMGAAASLRALDENPALCDGIVADSSYAYLRDEIAHIFSYKSGLPNVPFLPVMRLCASYVSGVSFDEVSPKDYITRASVPVFIIHSCADHITKPSDALTLFALGRSSGRRVSLWVAPPYAHASVYKHEPVRYKKKVEKFFRLTAAAKVASAKQSFGST